MHITWHGLSCVKLQTDTGLILINPYQDSVGISMPKLKVDIACSTDTDNDQCNNLQRLQGDPFLVETPGEYEVQGNFIYGIPAGHRTMYVVDAEGVTVGHPGTQLSHLKGTQLELFEGVDILLLPITGSDAKERADFISQVEPRIIIPIQYQSPKVKEKMDTLDVFAKEMGVKDTSGEKKLIMKKKQLPVEETQVIILDVA